MSDGSIGFQAAGALGMTSIDEALRRYAVTIVPLPPMTTLLGGALERVLAAPAASRIDLPPFVQSSMDGYALRSADTAGATDAKPARLRLAGVVPAGVLADPLDVRPGTAVRIYTGGHVPAGADTVLPQEDAEVDDSTLLVRRPVPAGEYVRGCGEELARGTTIADAGVRVSPGLVGALAVAGIADVVVSRAPKVAVLTTGDEVVAPGRELELGEIYDGNAPMAAAWLSANGYTDVTVGHLPDDLGATTRALEAALDETDLVIVTGGVSVGDRDFVPAAARQAGAEEIFWRVAQRPGKPLLFAKRGKTPLLGLPGNPAAVFVCLTIHVRRVLELLEGVADPRPTFAAGVMQFPVAPIESRELWARCQTAVGDDGKVALTALPRQASHMISNLAECTALARIPAGRDEVPAGRVVAWTRC